jgi:hypothetical protein
MKKTGVIILLICLQITGLYAQNNDTKKAAFQLSFFPPLSTQGTEAPKYDNHVSLNILAGISGSVNSFSISSLGMYAVNDISGFHLSGLATIAGNNGKGFMFAGGLNKTQDFQGLQIGGLANISNYVTGIQFGGLTNYNTGSVAGLQFAGLWNMNGKSMVGWQFASLGNVNRSDLVGSQFAGLSNINNGSMIGFQAAAFSNINRGNMKGFSIAGVQNLVSGDIIGNQIAGVVNTAKDVSGFQIGGLVNVAKNVTGFQLATLVNVAERNDYPIGLVNIIKYGGEMGLGITYNETGSAMLSFRSGGRILYGILGVGFNHDASKHKFFTEAGLGGHIPVSSRFRINNELKTNWNVVADKDAVSQHTFAVMPAFQITPQWELFAGPTLNYMSTENQDYKNLFPKHTIWKKFNEDRLQQIHIGFSAGIQLIF